MGGTIINKVRDRVISFEEEKMRLETVRALGLIAARYEPAVELLRKGMSADWWYFRTNYISVRPQHESAADLANRRSEFERTISKLNKAARVDPFERSRRAASQ